MLRTSGGGRGSCPGEVRRLSLRLSRGDGGLAGVPVGKMRLEEGEEGRGGRTVGGGRGAWEGRPLRLA